MIICDTDLEALSRTNTQVKCPVCGKSAFSQEYQSLHSSGIGQHITTRHPEVAKQLLRVSKAIEKALKEKASCEKIERNNRKFRTFKVTGEFLDSIIAEFSNYVDLSVDKRDRNSMDHGVFDIVDTIENMHQNARAQEK